MEFLGKIFAIAAVFGGLALARKYFRVPPNEKSPIEDLDLRFKKMKWIITLAMVMIGIIFAWSIHAALVQLNWHFATADGPARFVLLPQTATWWFLPGIGALALAWEITLELWSLFGSRKNATLYSDWTNQRAGFDSRKVLRWLSILIVLPIGVLTILALPVHSSIRQYDIRDCGYAFKTCKLYSHTAARRMTVIDGFRDRDGKLTRRAGIVLDFSDGRRWSSADLGNFQKHVDPVFANFLAEKTGLPVNYSQTEADIPR